MADRVSASPGSRFCRLGIIRKVRVDSPDLWQARKQNNVPAGRGPTPSASGRVPPAGREGAREVAQPVFERQGGGMEIHAGRPGSSSPWRLWRLGQAQVRPCPGRRPRGLPGDHPGRALAVCQRRPPTVSKRRDALMRFLRLLRIDHMEDGEACGSPTPCGQQDAVHAPRPSWPVPLCRRSALRRLLAGVSNHLAEGFAQQRRHALIKAASTISSIVPASPGRHGSFHRDARCGFGRKTIHAAADGRKRDRPQRVGLARARLLR